MKIEIKKVNILQNKIEIEYSQEGLEKYIEPTIIPFFEYEEDIEKTPKSIAVIPFLCNILPLCFVLDVEVFVEELDETFYHCIDEYRKAYQEMIPMISFKGKVIPNRIVKNKNLTKNPKSCLLFSGGIDATNSLVMNESEINDCITIWGSDIRINNENGWLAMKNNVLNIVEKFGKKMLIIKSNFRDYLNEANLEEQVKKSNDGWWHGFQHGIALLGMTAPLAYLNGYHKVFIASSFTKDFQPICASDPRTDACFKVANLITIHDGFEFDRCQKVENIYRWIIANKQELPIHVCWQSTTGSNCGHCEKCIRTYLNCRVVGFTGKEIGIIPTLSMKQIKRFYIRQVPISIYSEKRIKCFQNNLIQHYDAKHIPNDLKWLLDFELSKYKYTPYRIFKRIYYGALRHIKR